MQPFAAHLSRLMLVTNTPYSVKTTAAYCSIAESDRSARTKQTNALRAAGNPTLKYLVDEYAASQQADNIGLRLTGAGVSYVQYVSTMWHFWSIAVCRLLGLIGLGAATCAPTPWVAAEREASLSPEAAVVQLDARFIALLNEMCFLVCSPGHAGAKLSDLNDSGVPLGYRPDSSLELKADEKEPEPELDADAPPPPPSAPDAAARVRAPAEARDLAAVGNDERTTARQMLRLRGRQRRRGSRRTSCCARSSA
mmetsp:Transcript_34207/g.78832  ORF Transcript_34207/g.78832 Transcript_34207/m.78832 type:complete len:253 (-) Transcript_34207:827-1585(-)